jgi:hypothetical protein
MINKKSETYKRMTVMRSAFNGDGRSPNLFEPEKIGVNKIMDIIDSSPKITDHDIQKIKNEVDQVENSNHYDGTAWLDFKLHLNGLLRQVNYKIEFGERTSINSIGKINDSICLKFKMLKTVKNEPNPNSVLDKFWEFVTNFMRKILPKANPDYDDLIDNVETWLIEFDKESRFPDREIGIDENGNVLMIMPDEKNYGYWTDNNLKLEDFEVNFNTEKIGKEKFDTIWENFEKRKKY